jgi:hypothetical protein
MNNIILIFNFLLILFLGGCNKEEFIEEKQEEQVTLSVHSVYSKGDNKQDTNPISDVRVFVYYNLDWDDLVNYKIQKDGTMIGDNDLIKVADLKSTTNASGGVIFDINIINSYYMVFVMSDKFPNQTMNAFHHASERSADMTFVFKE